MIKSLITRADVPRRTVACSAFPPLLLSLIVLTGSAAAFAQATVYMEQDKLIRSNRDVVAYGTDLFGDQVNLYNGTVEFQQTDVSIPGNNALSVAIGRRLVPGTSGDGGVSLDGLFGDWDLDIPHLHGVFSNAAGWVTSSGTQSRCTGFGAPKSVVYQAATWNADEYWHGNFIYLPGKGSQEILTRSAGNGNYPGDGNAWPLTTQSMVTIRCLTSGMAQGTGDGFIALAPDGTQYRFDWMVSRSYPSISKPGPISEGLIAAGARSAGGRTTSAGIENPTPNVVGGYFLPRKEVWILPTLVTDRNGNTVTYSYDPTKPWRLNSITSSDGRSITLTYEGTSNRVSTVSDGTRTWTYIYSNGLNRITQPDGSQWQFALSTFTTAVSMYAGSPSCDNEGSLNGPTSGTMTHPSGAIGTFVLRPTSHGRSFVDRQCRGDPTTGDYAVYPRYIASLSLQSKTITGPGLSGLTWSYTYSDSSATASWSNCTGTCLDYKTVEVVDPRNVLTRYTFGTRYRVTEGQMQQVEVGPVGGAVARTTTMRYRSPTAGPYPSYAGTSPQRRGNGDLASRYTPQDQRAITQQGKTFTWEAAATSFDTRARPGTVTLFSDVGPGYTRIETTAYADQPAKWVLGRIGSITESTTGLVPVANTYDGSGNLLTVRKFGKLQATYTYYTNGTLWTAKDGLNNVTTYSNYMRGLAQNIAYADGKSASAVVENIGVITSLTNEAQQTTAYRYDDMGRLARIIYPGESWGSYNDTVLSFVPVGYAEAGLPPGHWRQTVTTGAGVVTNLFDGLWRKRVTYSSAAGAVASAQLMHYDADGRMTFQSYPLTDVQAVIDPVGADSYAVGGTTTAYETLGRISAVTIDTELTPPKWTRTSSYLLGFLTQSTDFKGNVSTSSYQAWDDPDNAALSSMAGPGGMNLAISRDVFGKATSMTKSGTDATSGLYTSVTRSWVYDPYQQLCKTIEPELGATLQDWDAAGNLAWRSGGTTLTSSACDRGSVPAVSKIAHGYDLRNRLTSTTYGDGSPAITRTYTDDGLPWQVSATGGVYPVIWTYGYNNRRLLTSERYTNSNDLSGGWLFQWGVDANGHISSLTDPWAGSWGVMNYGPDALGRPTQVSGYASNVSYHPNGAIAGYTTATGNISFAESQWPRGLPYVRQASAGSSLLLRDTYGYDANGNVVAIADGQGSTSNREMTYDSLDRLRTATGPWVSAVYSYDVQDNLRSSTVGTRTLSHGYDAQNRLSALAGTSITFDSNGNVSSRGMQSFAFDLGNRLRTAVGVADYLYDAHGLRTMTFYAGSSDYAHAAYTTDGKLRLSWRASQGGRRYVYLGGKLIAETADGVGTTYAITDALGSPVATTSSAGAVISRTMYEPYGGTAQVAGNTNPATIGFTGHVNDASTGLVYMQQRYYDPIGGRFLSVDPVTTNAGTGGHFNRYVYGENNPYRYRDPDGRAVETPWDAANVAMGAVSLVGNIASGNYAAAAVDAIGIVIDVAATAAPGVPGGAATVIQASRATSAMQRGRQAESKVLKAIGEEKNTAKIEANGSTSIPDYQNATTVGEIKDTARLTDSKQLRTQRAGAQQAGKKHEIQTGTNTKVSSTVETQSTVVRRDDLGPAKSE